MFVFDIVDPVELQAFVREIDPRVYGFTLDQFLPNQNRDDVKYAFKRRNRERQDVANYRSFDVEAQVGKRPGFAKIEGEILPMSKKYFIGEEDEIHIAAAKGDAAALIEAVFDDAALGTESLLARIELARGDVIFNGSLSFDNDEGFETLSIEYGTPTALSAPSVQWSTHSTATPIADMIGWDQEYADANSGSRAKAVLTSTSVIQHALQCDEVKQFMAVGTLVPSLVTLAQLNQILASLVLPPLVAYDTEVSIAGTDTRVTPLKSLAFLPGPSVRDFGETTFGPTAEGLALANAGFGTVATAPGLAGVILKEFDPVGTWTKISGIAVPVLKDVAKIATRANVIA